MSENKVLYRKYRSQSFKEVLSQDKSVEILIKSILNQNISHAYLFTGPRGTGKTTLARLVAKGVNCLQFDQQKDVCNVCENCLSINSNSANDIIEMDAASNRGIEEVRNLKETINYAPSFLKKKVYIIDEAHMLTKEAFNGLLKTLEEPPEHVIFILATTEAHKIPVTILSRVERYDLDLASEEQLTAKLKYIIESEGFQAESEVLTLLYKKSGGSFRDAESILSKLMSLDKDQTLTLEETEKILGVLNEESLDKLIELLIEKRADKILELINEYLNKGYSANNILDSLLERLYTLIIANLNMLDGSNTNNTYLKIVTLIINIKQISKEFVNKNLILNLEIVKFCKQESNSSSSQTRDGGEGKMANTSKDLPISSNQIEEAATSKSPKLHEQNQAGKDNELNEAKSFSLDAFKSNIVEKSREVYPRLRSIILNSNLKLEGANLIIEVNFEMNYLFLSKSEVRNYLLENVKLFNQNIDSISIVILSKSENDVLEGEPRVDTPEVKTVGETSIEEKESDLDNSALIEVSI